MRHCHTVLLVISVDVYFFFLRIGADQFLDTFLLDIVTLLRYPFLTLFWRWWFINLSLVLHRPTQGFARLAYFLMYNQLLCKECSVAVLTLNHVMTDFLGLWFNISVIHFRHFNFILFILLLVRWIIFLCWLHILLVLRTVKAISTWFVVSISTIYVWLLYVTIILDALLLSLILSQGLQLRTYIYELLCRGR